MHEGKNFIERTVTHAHRQTHTLTNNPRAANSCPTATYSVHSTNNKHNKSTIKKNAVWMRKRVSLGSVIFFHFVCMHACCECIGVRHFGWEFFSVRSLCSRLSKTIHETIFPMNCYSYCLTVFTVRLPHLRLLTSRSHTISLCHRLERTICNEMVN